MRTLYAISSIFLLLAIHIQSYGQGSFSVSPTYVEAEKPASNTVFYNFTQFTNNTTDTLRMKWVKKISEGRNGVPPPPEEWVTSINDPVNFFPIADSIDEAFFHLLPNQSVTEKLIFQVFPNEIGGEIQANFSILSW